MNIDPDLIWHYAKKKARRWLAWNLIQVVVVVALIVGALVLLTGCAAWRNGVPETGDDSWRLVDVEVEDRSFECLSWNGPRRAAISCTEAGR